MTDQRRAYLKAWRAANPERVREYGQRWKQRNPAKVRAYARTWAAEHPERGEAWRAANRERIKEHQQRRANKLIQLNWRVRADLETIARHLCITTTGDVYRRDTGERTPLYWIKGYSSVSARACIPGYKGILKVHQLVLAIHGPQQPVHKPMVLHNNGDKADNRLENLRWGNAMDNYRDALRHGSLIRPGRNAAAPVA